MTEDKLGITVLLTQVLGLYREVQNLLVSADDLMSSRSWKPESSTCITGSNSLDQPDQWFAQLAHRFYTNDAPQYASILSYVAVLLFNSGKPDALPQPLITGGWMEYGPKGINDSWEYWYARFHIWMPDVTNDGRVHNIGADHWPKWKLPFAKVSTLAVPLGDVTSTHELDQRVVGPLLVSIDASTS